MSRRLFYVVQPVLAEGSRLVGGSPREYRSAREAEQAGRALSRRASGVLVYMVEGDPEHDCWEEPELLARHGLTPDAAAG